MVGDTKIQSYALWLHYKALYNNALLLSPARPPARPPTQHAPAAATPPPRQEAYIIK